MLQSTLAGVAVTPETALRIVDVLACVRLLAESASTLPLKPYRRKANGERVLYTGKLAQLLERPAPATTQANLIAQLVGALALRGNAFLGKFRDGDGEIVQLGLLPPDRVQVELVRGEPVYTLTHDTGEQTRHGTEDVLHFKGLSMDGIVGLSPIAQAREALGLAGALAEYGSALFGNAATPQGVLTVAGSGPSQGDLIENLKTGFEARHRGAANAGRVAVLSGEVTFHPISLTPGDAEFIATRKLQTAEIARLFRVPAHLINGEAPGGSLTYSTVEMDALNFVRFSLAPWLVVIEQGIAADPDLSPSTVFVEFVLDAFLRPASTERAAVYSAALNPQTGWMRRSEVRRLENLEPEAA